MARPPGRSKAKRQERLLALAGVTDMRSALEYAGPRPTDSGKGPYGTKLSDALAMVVAGGLRSPFPGILPKADGTGGESRARTAKGFKKLDVNYSTPELGMALGVSIKTINYRDPGTKRYTKNYSRVDNELRAEAMDYHQRQPFAVLAGLLFLPFDACDDAGVEGTTPEENGVSSFGSSVKYFRNRITRARPEDPADLFERFFIGLHEADGATRGHLVFYDVARDRPPRNRRPVSKETLSLPEVLEQIRKTYDDRNNPPFDFSD